MIVNKRTANLWQVKPTRYNLQFKAQQTWKLLFPVRWKQLPSPQMAGGHLHTSLCAWRCFFSTARIFVWRFWGDLFGRVLTNLVD